MDIVSKKVLSIPLAVALCILTIGTLVHIQHWPFGLEIKLMSSLTIGLLYLIRYAYKQSKSLKDITKVIMVFTWTLLNVFVLYKLIDLFLLRVILEIAGIVWLALEIRDILKKEPTWKRANTPQLIGMGIVIMHAISMFQHWPFQIEIYFIALFAPLFMAIGFIIDYKTYHRNRI